MTIFFVMGLLASQVLEQGIAAEPLECVWAQANEASGGPEKQTPLEEKDREAEKGSEERCSDEQEKDDKEDLSPFLLLHDAGMAAQIALIHGKAAIAQGQLNGRHLPAYIRYCTWLI